MATVTVVGTTSWGTTLGIILAREGHVVRLMARTDDEALLLNSERENSRFVPGFPFPDSMRSTADPDDALASADLTIFAVPSQTMRANVRRLAERIPHDSILVSAAKGTGAEHSQAHEPGYRGRDAAGLGRGCMRPVRPQPGE